MSADSLRKSAAALAHAASKFESVATTLAGAARFERKTAAQVVVEGLSFAIHRYEAVKKVDKETLILESVTLVGQAEKEAVLKAGFKLD